MTTNKANRHRDTILSRCHELATISSMGDGICRTYLSEEHKICHAKVANWMASAGMRTWQDAVGNQWGRLTSANPNAKRIIIGSHLDTVPNAGAYDGILGVMIGIEIAQFYHDQGTDLPFHLDVVGFCDEEGTRFGTTLIGSSALAGNFKPEWLAITDQAEISIAQAMTDFGLKPDDYAKAALKSETVAGYLEIHIEQGPVLEAEQCSLGIVTAIAGARRANIHFIGQSGHAGTTPMSQRRDAASAAAELTLAIEAFANEQVNDLVATIGDIELQPGAVNVIAGQARLSLDVRSQDDTVRDTCCQYIERHAQLIAEKRGLSYQLDWYHKAPAVPCDGQWQDSIEKALVSCKLPIKYLPSGAGHDAMAIASLTPIGMLFIRSPNGLSHHPDESVITDDVTRAFCVSIEAIQNYALSIN